MHCHMSYICNLISLTKFVIMFYCYYATIIMVIKDLHIILLYLFTKTASTNM